MLGRKREGLFHLKEYKGEVKGGLCKIWDVVIEFDLDIVHLDEEPYILLLKRNGFEIGNMLFRIETPFKYK